MDYGFVGPGEVVLFILIVILVVGPRRIWRGYKVVRSRVTNFIQRLKTGKIAKQGRGVLRGFGKMIEYYTRKNKSAD